MGILLKTQATFIDFVLKEWLVIASGVGLILTVFYNTEIDGKYLLGNVNISSNKTLQPDP